MANILDSILFVIFVVFVVWLSRVPFRYTIKNIKRYDFDFYRDVTFYIEAIKARYKLLIGKFAISYILFYIIYCVVIFIINY